MIYMIYGTDHKNKSFFFQTDFHTCTDISRAPRDRKEFSTFLVWIRVRLVRTKFVQIANLGFTVARSAPSKLWSSYMRLLELALVVVRALLATTS